MTEYYKIVEIVKNQEEKPSKVWTDFICIGVFIYVLSILIQVLFASQYWKSITAYTESFLDVLTSIFMGTIDFKSIFLDLSNTEVLSPWTWLIPFIISSLIAGNVCSSKAKEETPFSARFLTSFLIPLIYLFSLSLSSGATFFQTICLLPTLFIKFQSTVLALYITVFISLSTGAGFYSLFGKAPHETQ